VPGRPFGIMKETGKECVPAYKPSGILKTVNLRFAT